MFVAMAREANSVEGVGERLRKVREARGLSRAKLGNMVGLSDDAVANYEKEKTKLIRHPDYLANFAGALGTTEQYLIEGETSQTAPNVIRERRKIYVLGPGHAGPPVADYGDVEEYYIDDWGTQRHRWGRVVRGVSMEPVLHEGDICILEEGEPESGWIVEGWRDGEGSTIKIYRGKENGKYDLEPANPSAQSNPGEWTIRGYCAEIHREVGGGMEQIIRNKFGGGINANRLRKA